MPTYLLRAKYTEEHNPEVKIKEIEAAHLTEAEGEAESLALNANGAIEEVQIFAMASISTSTRVTSSVRVDERGHSLPKLDPSPRAFHRLTKGD